MKKKLQIEVGKYYRNVAGETIHIVDKRDGHPTPYIGEGCASYTEDGRLFSDEETVWDLTYEVADPILQFFTYPRMELLNISAIETAAGMPSRTLYKFLKGTRALPKKHRAPLIEILKTLGYDG